jgi:CheY-like chemotaxis protein
MSTKKILVVEDDKFTQTLISDLLRAAGYQVVTAPDAPAAVKAARFEEPDLITLDIVFPAESPTDAMDGLKLATWLNRLNPDKKIPMIIISGVEPSRIIEGAAAVGAYTFLPKPFDKAKLLAAVESALK